AIARGEAGIDWRPDLVHCHDWQTGLVPALLAADANRPATVFTIHNLAYQGVFPATTLTALGLPASLWSIDALEFYGSLSFIKGGIAFADRVNTVSPTYAREIQTPAFGLGLDGLLRARADRMSGILNGIDVNAWNPARDRFITKPYSAKSYRDKAPNKSALQTEMGLPRATVPLFGLVGRLVEQKGIDLVLDAWPTLADTPSQLVVLGTGERTYEAALTQLAARFPDRVAVKIGYDEALAHRIEAGADVFLMPSRFEPCGLNQMYSLRYGTVPIVRRVGGLADTVVDVAASKQATGFVFDAPTADGLRQTVQRALALYHDAPAWQRLALNGMRQDFSWDRSADEYVALYRRALADRGA
ncbi:MAG: glycogen synthase GlgA, partial [Gammaproteobacteria bacterium]